MRAEPCLNPFKSGNFLFVLAVNEFGSAASFDLPSVGCDSTVSSVFRAFALPIQICPVCALRRDQSRTWTVVCSIDQFLVLLVRCLGSDAHTCCRGLSPGVHRKLFRTLELSPVYGLKISDFQVLPK